MKKGGTKLTTQEVKSMYIDYLELGSYNQVAIKYNKDRSTVRFALEKYRQNNPEEYNQIYSNYLQKSEEEFISKTTAVIQQAVEKISEKMQEDDNSIAQMATTMGILYDKRQLSMGKSTQNTAVVIKMEGDLQDLAK